MGVRGAAIMTVVSSLAALVYYVYFMLKKRLTSILTKLTIMVVSCGALLAIVCLLFRNQLLASVITVPFYGFYQICTTYLQSTSKSKKAILVSLMEKGIVYIPALLLICCSLRGFQTHFLNFSALFVKNHESYASFVYSVDFF